MHEESIETVSYIRDTGKRQNLVNPVVVASELDAAAQGASLAAIRPSEVAFIARRRSRTEIAEIRAIYEKQAEQMSMLDKELATFEPCPFRFTMHFKDGDGHQRKKTCADWETSAAFFNLSKRYSEKQALHHLEEQYCGEYVRRRLVFVLGNMAARPQTWQLLGIFPLPESTQSTMQF